MTDCIHQVGVELLSAYAARLKGLDLTKPADQWVRTRTNLVHQTFILGSDFPHANTGKAIRLDSEDQIDASYASFADV